jgi:hypothetical protein
MDQQLKTNELLTSVEPLFDMILGLNEIGERQACTTGVPAEQRQAFLDQRVFTNLSPLHPSWDSKMITYFQTSELLTVLDRCSKARVEVFGVEGFDENGLLLGVNIPAAASTDVSHSQFAQSFKHRDSAIFCASYGFRNVHLGLAREVTARRPRG